MRAHELVVGVAVAAACAFDEVRLRGQWPAHHRPMYTRRRRAVPFYSPSGWRTTYPLLERVDVCQRVPSVDSPLVSKRKPATYM